MTILTLLFGSGVKWIPIAVHIVEAMLHVLEALARLYGIG